MRIDRAVIRQRLERLLFELGEIEARLPAQVAEYVAPGSDPLRHELEHRLYIALQAMLDIAAHIAVSADVRPLDSYRDAMEALVALGVIEDELGRALSGAAGLRNAIAHDYAELDHALVYEAMTRTGDMRHFAKSVWEWVEER